MPKYICQTCGHQSEYSVPELASRVKVECPKQHGRMQYVGNLVAPWYKGHAFDSFVLVVPLLGFLHIGVQDFDATERFVVLGVALVMVAFEIGRVSQQSDLAGPRWNFGHGRLAVFLGSTALWMYFTQQEFDEGEVRILGILCSVAFVWHLARYTLLQKRLRQLAEDASEDFARGLLTQGIGMLVVPGAAYGAYTALEYLGIERSDIVGFFGAIPI